ncbi:hypothetical protein JZ751_024995 [Albula glossodonta]|uniref:Uncharacterized protein n=1 Tax=Albula glossodonta TaxID=121402 RepID=A0A8T2PF04_9TELE|nr:hypothetical protein JZ751_024995 [Albula glossodonta]
MYFSTTLQPFGKVFVAEPWRLAFNSENPRLNARTHPFETLRNNGVKVGITPRLKTHPLTNVNKTAVCSLCANKDTKMMP